MRRIYTYPQVPKKFILSIQYGGLVSSLIIFWLGITFPSQIKDLSRQTTTKFFNTPLKRNDEVNYGPYSDALARNFIKNLKINVDESKLTNDYNK